jgi:hypothetical protein
MRRSIMRRLVFTAAVLSCVLLWLPAVARAAADDIPGTPMTVGSTVTGVLDDVTKKYDVYSIRLTSGEQIQLDVADSTKGPCVYVNLIPPGTTSIFSSWSSLAYASTGNTGKGQFAYTPAKDGVYFLRVKADGNGVVYTLTLSGSAEKPPKPSILKLRSSAAQVRRGRTVALSASLATPTGDLIGGQTVSLQSSADGKTWKTVRSLSSGSGRYAAVVTIARSTWFRMRFAGDADHGACTSRKLLVKAK